jgi:hypothetical protein
MTPDASGSSILYFKYLMDRVNDFMKDLSGAYDRNRWPNPQPYPYDFNPFSGVRPPRGIASAPIGGAANALAQFDAAMGNRGPDTPSYSGLAPVYLSNSPGGNYSYQVVRNQPRNPSPPGVQGLFGSPSGQPVATTNSRNVIRPTSNRANASNEIDYRNGLRNVRSPISAGAVRGIFAR